LYDREEVNDRGAQEDFDIIPRPIDIHAGPIEVVVPTAPFTIFILLDLDLRKHCVRELLEFRNLEHMGRRRVEALEEGIDILEGLELKLGVDLAAGKKEALVSVEVGGDSDGDGRDHVGVY
jgi:hypothetical protein